jgi:hypothetical protein
MDIISTAHPVWQAFKHLEMHVDVTVISPPGAGCHFLSGMLGDGWYRRSTDANSWEAATPWLMLDENSIRIEDGCVRCQVDADQLWTRAQGMISDSRNWGQRRLAIGHEPPYLTSHVVDFKTTELISITVREQDCWIPKLLEVYKNRLTTDYRFKTYYLVELLNHNRFLGQIDNIEYLQAISALIPHLDGLDITATPFSMAYFCDSKANNRDPCDANNFYSYVRTHIDFRVYDLHYGCEYFDHNREWCGSRAAQYTPVDYRDLFFGLMQPTQGALAKIDRNQVAEYSHKNLEILAQALRLMPPSQRAELASKLDDLTQQLAQASG